MPRDIQNPTWIYLKAVMFILVGLMSGGLLWSEHPTLRTAVLLGLMAWAFARAYYFAFYVVEHYIDPRFRYSGLLAALRQLWWPTPGAGTNSDETPVQPSA